MSEMIINAEWLKYNAQLQQKKNKVRAELNDIGVLKRDGNNTYDKYKYFSEAQYKKLFTELLSKHGLELKFTELEYNMFEVQNSKTPNGRQTKLRFVLMDTETGFGEPSDITGEAMDRGDKAGYKAYTGALKYYLANTFMVATGDDPERDEESQKTAEMPKAPERPVQQQKATPQPELSGMKASPFQVEKLKEIYTGANLTKLLKKYNIEKLEDLPLEIASELIKLLEAKGKL